MRTSPTFKDGIVALARELGFALCRVAPADTPPHAAEFRRWIEEQQNGEMDWLARNAHRRTSPEAVLPGARSVVTLALNYWQGGDDAARPGFGRVARYAWGDDYHDTMQERLRALDAAMQEMGGRQRYYVDTGPVLERDFAALAGIGWQGKSTMLLNRELGTWFFLAELLTTLDLPPDEPAAVRCGSCTRCIDACPTGAIDAPFHLDARRCISYLTIELKGSIPEPLRPLIGDRIYGCDDCLTACPWNRFAQVSHEAAFVQRPAVRDLTLRDLLGIDDAQFRELFRGSPIKRLKRRGLLRNVCVALGNTGTAEDLPALEAAADDAEPLIAEHAAWALGQILNRAGCRS